MPSLQRFPSRRPSLYLGLLAGLLSGCTDTQFRDREVFNPPPDATNKFLGFFTASDKQTTCGNCHVLHQEDWSKTAHASAYSLLAGNPDATDACFTCHTVSDKGNATAGPAGWDLVQDTAYYDVQCENCHGPGLDHVMSPDAPKSASNPPLAHIGLLGPAGVFDSASAAQSCGACHNQNSGPGVRAFEEWEKSGHARALAAPAGNPAGGCTSCHEAKGILAAWGVTANYAEKSLTGPENYMGQTCAVCHDPHGTAEDANGQPIPGQLRFPLSTPDVNQNLCMKCHQRRSVPDQASSRGPHSPQGPMLLGEAGYQPAGFQPDLQAVATTHGSEKNPRLCAGCHVNRLTGTDVTTGKPATSAGHLFLPIPCLDAGGLPDLVNQDCPDDEASRSWASCTASGCHGSATAAVSAFALSSQRIDQLVKQIWDDKNGSGLINPDSTACSTLALPCANPTGSTTTDDANRANWDGGLLARTDLIPITGPGDQYALNDNKITPAEGARFNVFMLMEGGSDGSSGVHNPFLAEALLRANIDELRATYPGLPALRTSIQNILDGPLGAVTKRPLLRPLIARPISSR
jgi:cytochrome c7-like protein/cytochrome c554/c'-like protein